MTVPLLLAAALAITHAECDARPEWCTCRQYVAMVESRCEDRTLRIIDDPWLQGLAIKRCLQEERAGERACERNGSDDGYQPVDMGSDG